VTVADEQLSLFHGFAYHPDRRASPNRTADLGDLDVERAERVLADSSKNALAPKLCPGHGREAQVTFGDPTLCLQCGRPLGRADG
jgi:hypothetical protein